MEATSLSSPSQIESKLGTIWESLEGVHKMRACLFNLIIFAPKTSRDDYLHAIAQKVIEKFPSRVIFVSVDKQAKEDYLKASVSVLSVGKAAPDVACDLIQLDVAGSKQLQVPFVILPHILPDLPIYLVWAEDPSQDNPLIYQLEKLATRMIFDSESTDNLPRFADALLKHHVQSDVDIGDLNWARMENWRSLISSTFYSPDRLAQLRKSRTLKISFNSHKNLSFCHNRIQAIYLQAWLASQLEWQIKEIQPTQDQISLLYQSQKPLEVILIPVEHSTLNPGTITSFELTTYNDLHFLFTRNPNVPNHVSLRFSSKESCELPSAYIFTKGESGQSLVKEICYKGTSGHYLKTLQLIRSSDLLALC